MVLKNQVGSEQMSFKQATFSRTRIFTINEFTGLTQPGDRFASRALCSCQVVVPAKLGLETKMGQFRAEVTQGIMTPLL